MIRLALAIEYSLSLVEIAYLVNLPLYIFMFIGKSNRLHGLGFNIKYIDHNRVCGSIESSPCGGILGCIFVDCSSLLCHHVFVLESKMKRQLKLSIAVGTVLLLGACGQRGPLYLPSEAPTNQPAPSDAPLETPENNADATQNQQWQG
jgi:predicted small lipoprotein YifL